MPGYWQWPTERLVSDGTARSGTRADSLRLRTNRKVSICNDENIANAMLKEEQKNHLPYVLPKEPNNETYTLKGRDSDLRLIVY